MGTAFPDGTLKAFAFGVPLGKVPRATRATRYIGVVLCAFLVLMAAPAWGVSIQPERISLTLEVLQERLHTPILREGNLTVDLQKMVIDLRPENAEFRDGFYQILRKELQKAGSKPLGLDLSYSVVEGDFIGSDLGLRTPLYAQAIARIFTPAEQEQLERLRGVCVRSLAVGNSTSKDCRSLLSKSTTSSDINVFRGSLTLLETQFKGIVQFSNAFFLQSVNAEGAIFNQLSNWNETRFSRQVSFANAIFCKQNQMSGSIFFNKAGFKQVQFQAGVDFQNSTFAGTVNFSQTSFKQLAQFNHVQWESNADFSNVHFFNQVQFTKSNFQQLLLFPEAVFEQAVIFREAQFHQGVDLQGATIVNQADFSDAGLAPEAYLNVSSLIFNSNQGKILGNPGQIGKAFSVLQLQGNQNVLRNLGQNFRQLQQITDANQLDYIKQKLYLFELSNRLFTKNINTASSQGLMDLGFSSTQAAVIKSYTQEQPFHNLTELLNLLDINIDLETYNKISSQVVAFQPLSPINWLLLALIWLGLSILLLLSGYGTNFFLVFGVGIVAIAHFGLLFWLVDRCRRLRPSPILPTRDDIAWMLASYSILILSGTFAIFSSSEQPWLTLGCLALIVFPIPGTLLLRLYQQGRYHNFMDVSYFTEDGTMRQLRLLIGRLPIIPRYESFRERYLPLLWHQRWNWLNYYDFSLNNTLRLGFNDIRLRDRELPGIIATIAWYQWILGVLYITLLLWTLSRTIPGLNLLIYLK